MTWARVSRSNPCRICKKPDWCTYSDSGVACCMRVKSNRPMKNGGYSHGLGSAPSFVVPRPAKPAAAPKLNVTQMLKVWELATTSELIVQFAASISVAPPALASLGCVWAATHNAWAFPMRDAYGEPIGIRLRTIDGKKFAVTGSKSGLFIPESNPKPDLYITEGPTDCAAALSIGLYAIGRPACLGCEDMTNAFIRRNGIRRVVILSDFDSPGQAGAEKLQAALRVPSMIVTPLKKDIRASVASGLTAAMINFMTQQTVWSIPARGYRFDPASVLNR